MAKMRRAVMLCFGVLAGCLVPEDDDETTTDSTPPEVAPPVSVLLVVDTSESMFDKAESLAVHLDGLDEVLPDDARIGVITMDARSDRGALRGRGMAEGPDRIGDLRRAIVCEATCLASTLPRDAAHQCGDPIGSYLTQEYLECECGDDWGSCGSSQEEALEAVFQAVCRATEAPIPECTEDVTDDQGNLLVETDLAPRDLGTQPELIDGRTVVAVVITDEGDSSRRLAREPRATRYLDLLAKMKVEVVFGGLLPALNEAGTDLGCPGTGSDFGVARLHDAIERTGGTAEDLFDERCRPRDLEGVLAQVVAGSLPDADADADSDGLP